MLSNYQEDLARLAEERSPIKQTAEEAGTMVA